jgi:hypothetical protein
MLLSARHAKRSSIPGRRDNNTLAPEIRLHPTNLELEHLFQKAISVYEMGNIANERLASRLVILSIHIRTFAEDDGCSLCLLYSIIVRR